jgi:hypothetical protein
MGIVLGTEGVVVNTEWEMVLEKQVVVVVVVVYGYGIRKTGCCKNMVNSIRRTGCCCKDCMGIVSGTEGVAVNTEWKMVLGKQVVVVVYGYGIRKTGYCKNDML